jgi:hypothetical protein
MFAEYTKGLGSFGELSKERKRIRMSCSSQALPNFALMTCQPSVVPTVALSKGRNEPHNDS